MIDEKYGREVAALQGIKTTGFIGVLIKAKRDGHIESVREYIDRLVTEARFWLNPKLIEDVLRLVAEE